MKIAYLINQYPQASQSFIRREIAALEAHGVQIERFTVRQWDQKLVDEGDLAEQRRTRVVLHEGSFGLLKATLRVLFTRPKNFFSAARAALRLGRRGDRGPLVHLIYLAEACVLLRWFSDAGIDHVHAHFGTNSTTVAMLCRLLGGPRYSFTTHGPEEFDKPLAISLGEKVRGSAFAVAVSEFGRSQLYRWSDYSCWNKIHVVHCGVDSDFLDIARAKLTAPGEFPDAPRLVCVGRLAEQKGQLVLIQAAVRLAEDGIPFELVLVGDGPMRGEIERQISQHQLNANVRIAGWMSNEKIRQELLASRAMVLPSFAEGLPVVVMEALAMGRPVITTYVAGIPELVEDGQCGFLVPAGDVAALVAAMKKVLQSSPASLAIMGRNGAQRVLDRHDTNNEAKKLLDLFQRAASDVASSLSSIKPGITVMSRPSYAANPAYSDHFPAPAGFQQAAPEPIK